MEYLNVIALKRFLIKSSNFLMIKLLKQRHWSIETKQINHLTHVKFHENELETNCGCTGDSQWLVGGSQWENLLCSKLATAQIKICELSLCQTDSWHSFIPIELFQFCTEKNGETKTFVAFSHHLVVNEQKQALKHIAASKSGHLKHPMFLKMSFSDSKWISPVSWWENLQKHKPCLKLWTKTNKTSRESLWCLQNWPLHKSKICETSLCQPASWHSFIPNELMNKSKLWSKTLLPKLDTWHIQNF